MWTPALRHSNFQIPPLRSQSTRQHPDYIFLVWCRLLGLAKKTRKENAQGANYLYRVRPAALEDMVLVWDVKVSWRLRCWVGLNFDCWVRVWIRVSVRVEYGESGSCPLAV